MPDDRSRDPFQPAAPASPTPAPFDRPTPLDPVEPPVVRAKGGAMLVNVVLGLALVVAVGGVAFAAGRVTAPATAAGARTGPGQGGFVPGAGGPTASGAPGGGFAGAGGTSLQGTVTAVTADSITLQLTSGQSITIPTDAQTTWHQRESATAADVTNGSTVIVQLQGGFGGAGQGGPGQGGGATASGGPNRNLGPAATVTLVPAGS